MSEQPGSLDALGRLGVLLGHWSVEVGVQGTSAGTATIEWEVDGRFLLWRVTIPDPSFPDSLSVISVNADGETYTQHYFDARGVTRTYKMTLEAGAWTLLRDEPDFTPLEFSERFTGTIAPGGEIISGSWQSPGPDGQWRKDFDLVYRKTA
jgi:hypothetical protein